MTVPIVDARAKGFDLNTKFADLRTYPAFKVDVRAGSIGIVFYTVTDEGNHLKINFNIHAFVVLADGLH